MVLVGFKPDLWQPTGFLQCFDTVGLVIWPVKVVPEMTYYVLSGTLNHTHSHSRLCLALASTFMSRIFVVDWFSGMLRYKNNQSNVPSRLTAHGYAYFTVQNEQQVRKLPAHVVISLQRMRRINGKSTYGVKSNQLLRFIIIIIIIIIHFYSAYSPRIQRRWWR